MDAACFSDKSYRIGVDPVGGFGLGLGLVDSGIRGAIDTPVGLLVRKKSFHPRGIIDRQDVPVRKYESQPRGKPRKASRVSRQAAAKHL
jgi:hypothetical protein